MPAGRAQEKTKKALAGFSPVVPFYFRAAGFDKRRAVCQ
jgi:hypothetical protein